MAQTPDISLARNELTRLLLFTDIHAFNITEGGIRSMIDVILRTCNCCTRTNIQYLVPAIINSILPSTSRTAALIEYLITLSKASTPRDPSVFVDTREPLDENQGLGSVNGQVEQPPQSAFRRLHILYLVHDLLFFVLHHRDDTHEKNLWACRADGILEQLRYAVTILSQLTVCGCMGKQASTKSQVQELLAYWKNHGILTPAASKDLEEQIRVAAETQWNALISKVTGEETARKEVERLAAIEAAKWLVRDRHSVIDDPQAPWHELPAANGLYMKRVRGFPLRAAAFPPGGYPMPDAGYEADRKLRADVDSLYADVLRCYDKYTDASEVKNVDAMGNIIWKDQDRPKRNYWGWTLDGIEKRKEVAADLAERAVRYADVPRPQDRAMADAAERARALAGGRGRGNGYVDDGRDQRFDMGRGGFRGVSRGPSRGAPRGSFRGRPRW